jgi:DNA-binding NtrC family response regulator
MGGARQDRTEDSAAVLVADDEDDLRASLVDLLRGEGYAVDQARNGEEALAVVTGPSPPDLVLLDVNMPRLDGLDVLRQMRRLSARVGVIMMTAYGTPNIAIQAMQLGAYGYITKPLDADEVLLAVQRWYELHGRGRPVVGARPTRLEHAEDPITTLAEAVSLLLREAVERAGRGGAVHAVELDEMIARLDRVLGRLPGKVAD